MALYDLTDGLAALVAPRHTAILVIDVQNCFTEFCRFPPRDEVLTHLQQFLETARAAAAPVIFIQAVIPEESYSDVWQRQFPPGFREAMTPGSSGGAFHPGFAPRTGDIHVVKHRYSAFFGTPLASILRHRDIRTVIVTGFSTDNCVSCTVRDAFQLDFHVITLADCCGTISQERHETTLKIHAGNFGMVCSSAEVLAAWQGQQLVAAGLSEPVVEEVAGRAGHA